MKQLFFNLSLSFRSISNNLLRSILTIAIIAIGIMALVGILTSVDRRIRCAFLFGSCYWASQHRTGDGGCLDPEDIFNWLYCRCDLHGVSRTPDT